MLKDRFFKILFVILVSVALLHFFGIYRGGYKNFPQLDLPVHFFGGVWAGGMAVWLFKKHPVYAYIIGGAAALSLGIGWEIFEILSDPFLTSEAGYVSDTAIDLIMDTGGGLSAAFLFLRLRKK